MSCEVHVRFCEGVGVKFPRATRLTKLALDPMSQNTRSISSSCFFVKELNA